MAKQRATVQSRQTVDEDDNAGLLEDYNNSLQDRDEYTHHLDEYDDFVHDTLATDDRTNLLFKNILKTERGFKSLGARDSVLSGGGQRNSYTSRFSSKYGDNRLYLQRLSRNSLDSSQGLGAPAEPPTGQYQMKIRPKPRKYRHGEEMDESYFAKNSQEDGNNSREEPDDDKSDFFKSSKREFKIFDKKIKEKNYASNMIWTQKYTWLNLIPLGLSIQLQKPLNQYFLLIMLLQMVPWISDTGGEPTILYFLVPVLAL